MIVAQAVAAAALAGILFGFHRRFGKSYLLEWSRSWTAGAAAMLITAAEWHYPALREFAPLPSVAASALAAVQLAFFAFGCWGLARHREARLRTVRAVTPAFALAAALATVLIGAEDAQTITMLGTVAVSGAGAIWIGRWRARRKSPGLTLFTIALAVQALSCTTVALLSLSKGALSVAPFVFATQLGVGALMLVALLDDEREAAVLAASEIEHLAYNDPLTGLPNRSLFFDRVIVALAQATREQQHVAVLFLDIDRFKLINDSLGHTLGDALLRAAAARIRDCIRPGDTLARFGGDEFTILLPRIDRVHEVSAVALRILNAVRQPFHLAGRELVVTTSIGVSLYPADGLDAETLVKNADIAMYRAKEQGRDNWQLFTPELSSTALERLDLESRLRKALQNNELALFYQPLIHVEKATIHGFEALLRWHHRDLGLLGPAQFIEAAEVSGLTVTIGEWVLLQACNAARRWSEMFGVDLAVSVNLSARQLHEPELVTQVREALRSSGLPPALLDLEITETNAMRNPEATLRVLEQLKNLGVLISLDDFGTGYSSLSYLRRFPIDTLKLDRSFVRDVHRSDSAAISIAVIEMAKALGMKIVAEGVETEEQLEFLRQHGADFVQGFYFAQPLSELESAEFIARHTVPNLSTGPVRVQRLRLKNPPQQPELTRPVGAVPTVQVRTKSGSIRTTELRDSYNPRADLINDN